MFAVNMQGIAKPGAEIVILTLQCCVSIPRGYAFVELVKNLS